MFEVWAKPINENKKRLITTRESQKTANAVATALKSGGYKEVEIRPSVIPQELIKQVIKQKKDEEPKGVES